MPTERFEVREDLARGTFVILDTVTERLVGFAHAPTATEFATAEEAHRWVPAIVFVNGVATF